MQMNMDPMVNTVDNMEMDMPTTTSSDMMDPWYLRTLPGRTGDFMGHFIPGIAYMGLGLGLLWLALYRSRQLRVGGASFAEMHIPERNPVFLKWFGILNMTVPALGMIYECLDKDPGWDSIAMTHCTLYMSYFIMGLCALYEAKGRLTCDTHRAALVLACLLQALIWNAHGSMKQLPADGALHLLLGYINGVTAGVMAYSIRYTDSVFAYIAGWGLLVVQGIWIIISGLYECCINLQHHDVVTLLALVCLATFLGIVLVVIHFGPNLPETTTKGTFRVLTSTDTDDSSVEDDLDNCFP